MRTRRATPTATRQPCEWLNPNVNVVPKHANLRAIYPCLLILFVGLSASTATATLFSSFRQSNYWNCNTIWRLIFQWILMKFHDAIDATQCVCVAHHEKLEQKIDFRSDSIMTKMTRGGHTQMFFCIKSSGVFFCFRIWAFVATRHDNYKIHIAPRSLDIKAM